MHDLVGLYAKCLIKLEKLKHLSKKFSAVLPKCSKYFVGQLSKPLAFDSKLKVT
jgi:hypothetical protein